tara:strand:+ start:1557 stop:2774 length:1218 start_codon:yes stop_codon:yes gene_type:complete
VKNKKIVYKNFIQNEYIDKRLNKKYLRSFSNIFDKINSNLNITKNSLHLLSRNFKFNFKTRDLIKFRKFRTVVIIGMGGSILGSEAIYHFFKNKIKKNFVFLNNLNDSEILDLKKKYSLDKVLFILISKSGKTIESISNILALNIIKKRSKNLILVSEKNNNPFYLLAKKMELFHIEHKNYIGGRYSVLSEVGMLPAYLMGINIVSIRQNLIKHFKTKNKFFLKQSTIKLANILQAKKFKNIIFLNYSPRLEKFLFWKQQLTAESLGKKGKGFLPFVSSAPKDHHSLLQLYLDGPRDKLFYIFSEGVSRTKKLNSNILGKNYNFLNRKSLNEIKNAQKKAFIKTLMKKRIPFREFIIGDFSEKNLGELFSYFMLETAIIGKLININPFDQPAVEQVKANTKKLLI